MGWYVTPLTVTSTYALGVMDTGSVEGVSSVASEGRSVGEATSSVAIGIAVGSDVGATVSVAAAGLTARVGAASPGMTADLEKSLILTHCFMQALFRWLKWHRL